MSKLKQATKQKNPGSEPTRTNEFPVLYVLAVVAAAAFAFSPGLSNGFVNWDDYAYIVNNSLVHDLSPANILKIFTPTTFVVGNYHPLTVLCYAVQHAIFGLDPAGYHGVNIAIHLVNILLISLIGWRIFKHRMATVAMTALFALHPLRVESVVWAAELKDVLYVCFFLAATYVYIVNVQSGKDTFRAHVPVFLLFLLSLLSKGQAVVFPVIMLIVDYITSRTWSKQMLIEKVPYFVTSVAFGLLAISAQRGGQLSVTGPQLVLPFAERLACALYGILMYFFKFAFPANLACFYDYPLPEEMGSVFIYAGISALLLGASFFASRRDRVILGGLAWFAVVIGPVSQIMPVGNALYADRYSYLSMVGIAFIAAYGVQRLSARYSHTYVLSGVGVTAVLLTMLAYGQAHTWNNNITLWTAAQKANTHSALILNNLAGDYLDSNKLDKAIPLFEEAIENPGRYKEIYRTLNNLGLAVSRMGMRDSSLYWFKRAIETDSAFADPYFNRGSIMQFMNRQPEAYADFTRFIRVTRGDSRGYLMRAKLLRSMDSTDASIRDYRSAISSNPTYLDAYLGLANVFFNQKNYSSALETYTAAIENISDNGLLFLNRAKVRFVMADFSAALQDYDAADVRGAKEPGLRQAIMQSLPKTNGAAPAQLQVRR